jgi:three-Cys-motif partner protein
MRHWGMAAAFGSGERKAQGHVFSWYDCAGVDSTGMADASFFDAPTEASTKKQRIVSKYFGGWANIVLPKTLPREGKIMVMDLFSGPGRYRDGTPSTPLLILDHVVNTPVLRDVTQLFFNDEEPEFVEALKKEVADFPGIETLRYKPVFRAKSIDRGIIPKIREVKVPTLFFADPWGYAGISVDLIEASIAHWGSDFLFFFNYNRINMNLGCEGMNGPINEFFSAERAEELRRTVERLRPAQREEAILKAMQGAIKNLGAQVGKFTYRSKTGSRATHHLLCVSKHRQGMALFKEISAKESTSFDYDVPSLEHDPSAETYQQGLFSPLAELEEELLATYAGKVLTPNQIYHDHHNGKPYILKNYRQALLHLEETGAVRIDPPRTNRPRSESFPRETLVTFTRVG